MAGVLLADDRRDLSTGRIWPATEMHSCNLADATYDSDNQTYLGRELRSSCVRKMTQNPRMHKAKGTFRIGHGYRLLQFVATFHRRPIRVRHRLFDPKRAVVIKRRNALGGSNKIRTASFGYPADKLDNGLPRSRGSPFL